MAANTLGHHAARPLLAVVVGYSALAMKDALYDNVAVRTVARIASDPVPGELTICISRRLPERHALGH